MLCIKVLVVNWATNATMATLLMPAPTQAEVQGCRLEGTRGTAQSGKYELMQGQEWTWRE